jgi:hypothetical protein
MNRFPKENTSDLAANYERQMAAQVWDDDLQSSGAVNICENCQHPCERLNDVAEFGFRGCDRCYDEAMEIMKNGATALLETAPADCGSDRKSIKSDHPLLNPSPWKEGGVAMTPTDQKRSYRWKLRSNSPDRAESFPRV